MAISYSSPEVTTMNILGSIMGKILGHSARASESKANAAAAAAPAVPARPAAAATASAAPPVVDVEVVMETMAAGTSQKLDWRHSIVDLMKVVGIESSLANRKALAQELGYTGDTNDSATMNVWLHKEVLRKLSENGGQVPANLLD
jgi:3-oxoacyl-ACP reductase-like protein